MILAQLPMGKSSTLAVMANLGSQLDWILAGRSAKIFPRRVG